MLQVPAKGWIGATDVDARERDGRAVTILAMVTWVAARGVGNEIGLQHIPARQSALYSEQSIQARVFNASAQNYRNQDLL